MSTSTFTQLLSSENSPDWFSSVQWCFTSTERVRTIRDGEPRRPPRLSHSSWAPKIAQNGSVQFIVALHPESVYGLLGTPTSTFTQFLSWQNDSLRICSAFILRCEHAVGFVWKIPCTIYIYKFPFIHLQKKRRAEGNEEDEGLYWEIPIGVHWAASIAGCHPPLHGERGSCEFRIYWTTIAGAVIRVTHIGHCTSHRSLCHW